MRKLIAFILAVIVYLWDDILLGAPVAFLSGYIGVLNAFLLTAFIYGLVSYGITLKIVKKAAEGTFADKLQSWVVGVAEKSHGRFGLKLIARFGGYVGLFLSSWLAGGIITTYLVVAGGYKGNVKRLAAVSNVIFAVLFCAQYSGLGWLINELIL